MTATAVLHANEKNVSEINCFFKVVSSYRREGGNRRSEVAFGGCNEGKLLLRPNV